MKTFKILFLALLVLLFIGILFKGSLWIEKYLDESVSGLKSDIPEDYIALLGLDSNYIGHSKTIFTDDNPIITSFEYKDNLGITAIKLSSFTRNPLYKVVSCHNDLTALGIDGGVIYSSLENDLIKMSYTSSYPSIQVEYMNIHFARSNFSEELIVNDSTCAYFIKNSHGFKMQFNENHYHDISVEVLPQNIFEKSNKKGDTSTNMLLLLRKQNGFLYMFLVHKKEIEMKEIDESIIDTFVDPKH